ncbi:hypothetical protein NDU88_000975 [Pleurodeles waltl]|uniref:Uncharacterized protein n=1 Tax=Pleurodeles waltl TaxID=8319 RepID=A0AAV7U516_PLEWA|nr:hypothetical protein NDU88_000975 [Pleurodeles waltl]
MGQALPAVACRRSRWASTTSGAPRAPPDTPLRVQARCPSRSPSSRAPSYAQGLRAAHFPVPVASRLLPLTREEGAEGPPAGQAVVTPSLAAA